MRILKAAAAALLAVSTLAAPAFANAKQETARFVNQVRTEAAFHDIEVNRIRWGRGVVTAFGTDQLGHEKSITRPCRQGYMDCPLTVEYAERDNGETMAEGN